jgi:hypothetical protein
MMGRQRRDQGKLFYEFRLEDRIPENHLLRRINVLVTTALADLHNGLEGVVTLSEIGPIWTINQQAKSLKSLASTLAIVGKFRSV